MCLIAHYEISLCALLCVALPRYQSAVDVYPGRLRNSLQINLEIRYTAAHNQRDIDSELLLPIAALVRAKRHLEVRPSHLTATDKRFDLRVVREGP
jgi:hypothetical protein